MNILQLVPPNNSSVLLK